LHEDESELGKCSAFPDKPKPGGSQMKVAVSIATSARKNQKYTSWRILASIESDSQNLQRLIDDDPLKLSVWSKIEF
jgi:hypothetical protein